MGVEQQWLAAQWRRSEGGNLGFYHNQRASSTDSPPSSSPTKVSGSASSLRDTSGRQTASQAMTTHNQGSLSALQGKLGSALKDNLGKMGVGEEQLTGARDTVQVCLKHCIEKWCVVDVETILHTACDVHLRTLNRRTVFKINFFHGGVSCIDMASRKGRKRQCHWWCRHKQTRQRTSLGEP